MARRPEKTPIDGKDSRLRSFRLRQPPRAATQRQPRQRKHRPFRGGPPPFFSLRRLVGKPFPASLPSSVRWRPVTAHRVRGSAGAPPCAAAVGAAQPVPPPLGPLACAVAVLPAPARLRHRTGEGPAPRRQEQRVPVTLLKKGKTQKESVQNRCRRCRVLCPRFRVVALPASRPGVAAGSRTGERRCPRPLHRYPG